MKKSTFVLSASLCMGLAQMGFTPIAHAQPAPLSYSQARTLAKQDLEAKNYEAAEKEALQMVALAGSPDETGVARMVLGQSFYLRKMYEPARAQWNHLLTLNPNGNGATVGHLLLARTYSAEGIFEKSIPHYVAAISAFDEPDEKDVADKPNEKDDSNESGMGTILSLGLANAYYQTEQFDLAQKPLNRVIKSAQDNSFLQLIALTRLSEIDFMEFRLKKAVEGFTQVLAIKIDAPALKRYAQAQIVWSNLLVQTNWEGKRDLNLKIDIRNGPGGQTLNEGIQVLNDTLIDAAFVAALEE
jgi:tetratricopeptide (TPR) repeat protein